MHAGDTGVAQTDEELLHQLRSHTHSAPGRFDVHVQVGRVVAPKPALERSRESSFRPLFKAKKLSYEPASIPVSRVAAVADIDEERQRKAPELRFGESMTVRATRQRILARTPTLEPSYMC